MRKNVFSLAIMFIAIAVLFIGCQQDESTSLSSQKVTDPEVLKELRFMKNEGMITPDDYEYSTQVGNLPLKWKNYDGTETEMYSSSLNHDAVYSRATIQNMMREKASMSSIYSKHRKSAYMFSSSGGTITIRVKTSGTPCSAVSSLQQTAITDAVAEWNALGYKVKFSTITTTSCSNLSGYINVEMGDTGKGGSNVASTEYPQSSGSFGQVLRINTAYTGTTLTASAKKVAIAHELGHAIGLMHTDSSEGSGVATSCNGSSNYTDSGSIFKSTMLYNQSWTGFTSCDKVVLDYYWQCLNN